MLLQIGLLGWSHACLQRISSGLALAALTADCSSDTPLSERDAIEQHFVRATVRKNEIEIVFRSCAPSERPSDAPASVTSVPFTPFSFPKKGVQHRPSASPGLTEADRTTILTAIARSRAWVDAILRDPDETFESIAAREGRSARYIKLLAPLAYVSPRLVEALADGRTVGNLTVTALAKSPPLSWAEQERAYLPS